MRLSAPVIAAVALLAVALSAPAAPPRTRGQIEAYRRLHGGPGARVYRVDDQIEVAVYIPGLTPPPRLLTALARAAAELEAAFGPAGDPVRVQFGGPSTSMKVAYNPAEDAVIFPANPRAVDHGVHDLDRLRHELFHAWVGRVLPHLVTPEALAKEEVRVVHEAAADFFAWMADENGAFGDRYLPDGRGIRDYRTAMRYPLVKGSHAKGNALTSYWIRAGRGLRDLAADLAGGCETPACMVPEADHGAFGLDPETRPRVTLGVRGHAPSKISRYRVHAGDILELHANEALAGEQLETRFTTKDGASVSGWAFEPLAAPPGTRRFRIRPAPAAPPSKVIVRHLAGGAVIGFDVLYLSRAAAAAPATP